VEAPDKGRRKVQGQQLVGSEEEDTGFFYLTRKTNVELGGGISVKRGVSKVRLIQFKRARARQSLG